MNQRRFSWLGICLTALFFLSACRPQLLGGAMWPTEQDALEIVIHERSTGGAQSAAEIFAAISPSVAFVETPTGTGSGVLIDHGYLLSNAHVVWPHNAVRVTFPDGSEYKDVPVHA